MRPISCLRGSLAFLLLSGCGGSSATESKRPSFSGDLDKVVVEVTTEGSDGSFSTEGFVCSTDHRPVSLGPVSDGIESPDARYVAVFRDTAVDIVSLDDGVRISLPGSIAPLAALRWSDAVDRLAFVADGVPMLAGPDGSDPVALDVEVPEAGSDYSYAAAEWSPDGQKVAFVTRGLGIMADADGSNVQIFSRTMVGPYGTPWAVAFAPDGRHVAGLQTLEPAEDKRTVIVVDTETLASREFEVMHYAFVGFTGDGSAIGLWDVGVNLWLVPFGDGEPRTFQGWASLPSPATNEVALGGPGLHVVNLDDESDRALLPETDNVQAVSWSPDGDILGYLLASETASGYVWAADGTRIADGWGIERRDGWVALPEPGTGFRTRDLRGDPSSGHHFAMTFPNELSQTYDLVTWWRVAWLNDGRLAYLSDDGLHVADKSGSPNVIAGPLADIIVPLQASRY